MGKVQSSETQVGEIVSSMKAAANAPSDQSIESASRTTVAGNSLAEKTMNKHTEIFDNLLASFRKDAERLKSVSHEFKKTDCSNAKMISFK